MCKIICIHLVHTAHFIKMRSGGSDYVETIMRLEKKKENHHNNIYSSDSDSKENANNKKEGKCLE